jgi:hypothetical protein
MTDTGKLCTWDMTRLSEPLTYTFLNYPSPQASLAGFPSSTIAGGGLGSILDIGANAGGVVRACASPTTSSTHGRKMHVLPLDNEVSHGMGGPLNVCAMSFEQNEAETNIIFGTGSGQIFRSALPYKPNYPPLNQVIIFTAEPY